MEELIVKAIKSDTKAQHQVFWQEAGHDDKADIEVRTNSDYHRIQVKSGQIQARKLKLSGHRLSRFQGNLKDITNYLNSNSANIITVPYRKEDNEQGRQHIYKVCYVDIQHLTGLSDTEWTEKGKQFIQDNDTGVRFSLAPSMSWQIWWTIPESLIEHTDEFIFG